MERYKEYKDSGVEWIGDIPRHWAVAKLGLYAEKIGSGSTPRGGVEVYVDTGVPFIRSQNVHFDGLRLNGVSFIKSDVHDSMRGSCVLEGDVLLNITGGSIGRCCVVNEEGEMNVNQHVSIIRVDSRLFNTYLNFLLQGDVGQSQVQYNLTGGNRDGLTIDGIGNFRLTVPPVEEQERIVAFLDERTGWIDEAVKKTEKKIALLKEQRASLINEVVTKGLDSNVELKDSGVEWIGDIPSHWKKTKVKHQFQFSGGATPSTQVAEYWGGDIPWVSSKDVKVKFLEATEDYVTQKGVDSCSCRIVAVGSLVMVVRSGILQRTIPVAITRVPLVVNQDQKVLTASADTSPDWLYYFIKGNERNLLTDWVKEGTTVESIDIEALEDQLFGVPPVEEQERIVAFLDERTGMMDEVIVKEEERIVLLKEYRQSLISEVVTGKRRVLDEPVGLN